MLKVIVSLLLMPFKLAALLLELLGRTVALIIGLSLVGVGGLLSMVPPFILLGAPMFVVGVIIVIKAI